MMHSARKFWRRLRYLFERRRLERELAEEMAAHREMMPADRRPQFGNTTRLREESREIWSWIWLEQLWQDLCYGARTLRRAPGFTAGAVAILALGIGVNLAEFQIFDALLFHRFAVADADSILQFSRVSRQRSNRGFASGAIAFYRDHSSSFAWLVSEDTSLGVLVEGETGLRSDLVSANYFGSLGVVPAWGRLLDAHDGQPGAPAVAVLGYEYWQSHWGSDPRAVGRFVHVNNQPFEIVGVLPYTFDGLASRRIAVWLPAAARPLLLAGSHPIQSDFSRATNTLFGKLKTGISRAAGEAELTSLTRALIRSQPHSFQDGERIQSEAAQETMIYRVARSPAMAIFITMILLILLSACANLGNMLLARGLVRQQEIDIRVAVGAGRGRMLRQLMTENLLLATLGTAAGLAFGVAAAHLLLREVNAPPSIHLTMSWPIFAAGAALACLSTLAFGLPSAWQTVRASRRKVSLRQNLVGVQVAVSCLLLISSSVLAHKGIVSAAVNVAFDYRNMIVIDPQLYARNLPVPIVREKLDALTTQLKALPGVQGVTAAVAPPLGGRVLIESLPGLPRIYRDAVAPSYFSVMQLPIVRGRTFFEGERNAVIVSESAARTIWPDGDAVGKIWKFAGASRTVTGIAKDSGANLIADPDSIEAYTPIDDPEIAGSALIVHSWIDPGLFVRMLPSTLHEAVSVSLMRAFRDNFIEGQNKFITLIGSVGALATVLAAAGMFALVGFAVAQRKRELGIRIAIGAKRHHILETLLLQNVKPTIAGAIAGVILAAIFSHVLRSFILLPNGGAVDVIGFAGGLAFFALVAALATLSPALRALRIDPSVTLREE